ncbi:hypothetical protein LX16_2081 [Stackebrandtia albiflava]|uniref:Uncharacterized protein n=1 Tax=Stackebrandtia albiflava TaxID=406432 RepID=A0A562VEP7_9ACTN|nr:hypothetical protein [Stackebrandtia albiflava]TWJ16352.1 hypothetical protein LX16_2081 [Stackebrandtia albiflava]
MTTHIDSRPSHRRLVLTAGWLGVALLVGYATWAGAIAMDLMLVILSVVELFGGTDVLPFAPDWLGMLGRVAAVAVAGYLALRTVRYQRTSRGACARCGRAEAPRRDLSRAARIAAYLTVIPAGGYAALKLHWAFGGGIGLADPDVFDGVTLTSPGFADTAVMAAIGVGLAVAMTHRWRLPRWMLLAPSLFGLAMLIPVSVFGTAVNVTHLFDPVETGLATWVGWFVYTCFTVWAAGLLLVTVDYHQATAGTCRSCGRERRARIAA